ncbi:Alpha/Beta hydrolase protein, partial [Chytriomyces sp. MP71]
RPKFVRDFFSIVFSIFYLFNFDKADSKMKKYHAAISIEMLRAKWNKKLNPYLRGLAVADTGILGIRRNILIQRQTTPPSPTAFTKELQPLLPIKARIFYSGSEKAFAQSDKLILSIPGGGFCAMPPQAHEDYLSVWARRCKVPIVSLDYDKCPEKPYPWQLEQCFDAYRAIVETNGAAIGMEGWYARETLEKKKPINIVLAGDSAGGNLSTAVTLKVLDKSTGIELRPPNGLVIIYPAYSFDPPCWIPNKHRSLFRSASTVSAPLNSFVHTRGSIKPDAPFSMPPAPRSIDVMKDEADRSVSWYVKLWETIRGKTSGPRIPSALTMSSHMSYFTDLVMPPEILRAISLLMLGITPLPIRFDTDYLLCPINAPDELLARFPKMHFICGEKDPFVDDMIIFGEKVRAAKMKALREWERMREARSASRRNSSDPFGNDDDVLSMDRKRPASGVRVHGLLAAKPEGVRAAGIGGFLNHHDLNDDEFAHHIYHHDPNNMVQMKILEGCSHGFLLMLSIFPEARPAVNLCADWCTEMLEDEELGYSMTNPGSFTDLMAAVDADQGHEMMTQTTILKGKLERAGSLRAANTAEVLRSGSVKAEQVLERRRATLAESHEIN